MIPYTMDTAYIPSESVRLFTVVLRPDSSGQFPTVVVRTPYVDSYESMPEDQIAAAYLAENIDWLRRGYAMVIQHCRGRGKSTGDCVPYIHEREDGLALLDWIRRRPFYNGEIFLKGESYLTSVHYAVAPFPADIRGAVFGVQDCERYNICYRNGCFKIGLHGDWYVGMYKPKTIRHKNYVPGAFQTLPLRDFTQTVFGEPADDFDRMLAAPRRDDPFWQTRAGGSDARDAVRDASFPILLTTGFYDIYTGGIFDMWRAMTAETRARCALVVSPYDHPDQVDGAHSVAFPSGQRKAQFGAQYEIDWFDGIRGKRSMPFPQGLVTYYRLFENCWASDAFAPEPQSVTVPLGSESVTYTYNPYAPPEFPGGLSCNFGGAVFQNPPGSRPDIVTVYTAPFESDVFVKGEASAELCVSSDCSDTGFFVRLSLETPQGDFGLRDDITSLCYQLGDYTPGTMVPLRFRFDPHAFRIAKGQRLRIDIASADAAHYVRHTNCKGLFSAQTTARIAHNTVDLAQSSLTLPIESNRTFR